MVGWHVCWVQCLPQKVHIDKVVDDHCGPHLLPLHSSRKIIICSLTNTVFYFFSSKVQQSTLFYNRGMIRWHATETSNACEEEGHVGYFPFHDQSQQCSGWKSASYKIVLMSRSISVPRHGKKAQWSCPGFILGQYIKRKTFTELWVVAIPLLLCLYVKS